MLAEPALEQLRAIAHMYGMHLSDADLASFRGMISTTLESYRRVDQLNEPVPIVRTFCTNGQLLPWQRRESSERLVSEVFYQRCCKRTPDRKTDRHQR